MTSTTFQAHDITEPDPYASPLWRLRKRGDDCIAEAEKIIGVARRPADRRDHHNVRGLACKLMRERYGDRYSWSDIALAVYGRRKHNTALSAANRWKGLK